MNSEELRRLICYHYHWQAYHPPSSLICRHREALIWNAVFGILTRSGGVGPPDNSAEMRLAAYQHPSMDSLRTAWIGPNHGNVLEQLMPKVQLMKNYCSKSFELLVQLNAAAARPRPCQPTTKAVGSTDPYTRLPKSMSSEKDMLSLQGQWLHVVTTAYPDKSTGTPEPRRR